MAIKKVSSLILSEKTLVTEPAPSTPAPGEGGTGPDLTWQESIDEQVIRDGQTVWVNNNLQPTLKIKRGPLLNFGGANSASNLTITYSATGLPGSIIINSSNGTISGTASTVGYNQVTVFANTSSSSISKTIYVCERSQTEYITTGTYTFTVPNYVTKISAVVVGGGGASGNGPATPNEFGRGGAAGGGLRWIRDLPVTPGEEITVVVGAGGTAYPFPPPIPAPFVPVRAGSPGEPSKIVKGTGPTQTTVLEAIGGAGSSGTTASGGLPNPAPESLLFGGGGTSFGLKPDGSFVGGGNGGDGKWRGTSIINSGAGAGGYNGKGGRGMQSSPFPVNSLPSDPGTVGATNGITVRQEFGLGGAGSGGSRTAPLSGGGGGVGIWGESAIKFSPFHIALPSAPSAHSAAQTLPATDVFLDSIEIAEDRNPIGWNTTPNGFVIHPGGPSLTAPVKGGNIFGNAGSFGFHAKTRPNAYNPAIPFFQYVVPPINSAVTDFHQGGLFGGGSGTQGPISPDIFHTGGRGAARIFWGSDRDWPSTNTGDQ